MESRFLISGSLSGVSGENYKFGLLCQIRGELVFLLLGIDVSESEVRLPILCASN